MKKAFLLLSLAACLDMGAAERLGCLQPRGAEPSCLTAPDEGPRNVVRRSAESDSARARLATAIASCDGHDWDISEYTAIYADGDASYETLDDAATRLELAVSRTLAYPFGSYNDYSVFLEPATNVTWVADDDGCHAVIPAGETTTLKATFTVDEDALFSWRPSYSSSAHTLRMTVDGVETFNWGNASWNGKMHRYVELAAGEHTVIWEMKNGNASSKFYQYIDDIWVEKNPLVTVNLLEPGSLGTEVLYNVDKLQDVRRLKIIGTMNSDDWDKIDMMKARLTMLDLSETTETELTTVFSYSSYPCLYAVKLPSGLKTIGNSVFKNAQIEEIEIPKTVTSIGSSAFHESQIKKISLPDSCTSIGESAFNTCRFLEDVTLPASLTSIPKNCFSSCDSLNTFELPSELLTIGETAFYGCKRTAFKLPAKLTSIGEEAFYETYLTGDIDSLIIPKNCSYLGVEAFKGCQSFSYVELPVAYTSVINYSYGESKPFGTNVTTIRLNCPAVVTAGDGYRHIVASGHRANVTLIVPQFLVNSYKLDDYWYNFKEVKGFSTSEISDWTINSDVVLGAHDRLEGTPTVTINTGGSLKVNGEDAMPINNLTISSNPGGSAYGRMYSNAYGVTVEGDLTMLLNAAATKTWYFLSLPFNVKVSDIVPLTSATALRAVRYYDGANRAANGASGSWKDFDEDDIIPAGTGFIFQSSEATWWKVPAQEDDTKQYLTSNNVFAKALDANAADNTADAGWNLVGNPYQSWYNIHKLNFTAPITVYESNKYAAYSVIDDDYAIAPNQAFFVQCPDGITSISFPLGGRQMTSTIESQSGAKPHGAQQAESRRIVDLTVTANGDSDRTRIVLNEETTADYDINCDASKFMSDVAGVSQLYSLDGNSVCYAINERPQADGKVRLGFVAGEGGCFTFKLTRNTLGTVILVDNETGVNVDLSTQDYDFTANAGTYDDRFELRLADGETNGIEAVGSNGGSVKTIDGGISLGTAAEVYSVGGVKVAEGKAGTTVSLPAGSYVVKTAAGTAKIAVK